MSASLAPECNEVKERYDTCFLKWYSESEHSLYYETGYPFGDSDLNHVEFLRGNAASDECEPLFKQYRVCLTKALKDRGLDSMLNEAKDGDRDADAEHSR